MIISCDFDGCLVKHNWPKIGKQNKEQRRLLKDLIALQSKGHILILNTGREGKLLKKAVKWCKKQGLIFDRINENWNPAFKGYRKIIADIYIDDKACKPEDFYQELLRIFKKKKDDSFQDMQEVTTAKVYQGEAKDIKVMYKTRFLQGINMTDKVIIGTKGYYK